MSNLNIKKHIVKAVSRVEHANKSRTEKYKSRLKQQIVQELKKAQTPEQRKRIVKQNEGTVMRYYNAKPQPLTQMQQAMLEAAR